MTNPTLGVAMIMQNEEGHIAPSIAQFYQVADDIVVVDGGSGDKSVAWAERMGARVFHRPFDRDFSAQKNFALEQLDTDWIYLHDPDERLEPTLVEVLPSLLHEDGQRVLMRPDVGMLPNSGDLFDCFGIPRKNFIDGLQIEVYPDYQYRLFRKHCRYEGRVHEGIVGFDKRTELDFKHHSKSDPARANILHYKSSAKQEAQIAMYADIERAVRGGKA